MKSNFRVVMEKDDLDHKIYIVSFTHRTDKSERTVFIEKKFLSMDEVEKFIKNYGFNFSSAEESVVYEMEAVKVYRRYTS